MKYTEGEKQFLKQHRVLVGSIIEKRIEELKEYILVSPEEKRSLIIAIIKELKLFLTDISRLKDKNKDEFTGV